MRVNYNISSIIARNALNSNDNKLSKSIERLSSGFKINHAADDAAGLAISIRMNSQLKKLEQANQNANDGISIVNTADGAMSEVHEILQRMNELSVKAANGTYADEERAQIQLEIDQLIKEVDRISETVEFNAQKLFDGSFAYKGYTNTENVKVKSYSEDVPKGIYEIKGIEYAVIEDLVTECDTNKTSKKEGLLVEEPDKIIEKLEVANDDGKSFPKNCRVETKDESIVIKAENGFELSLEVNIHEKIGQNVVDTTKKPPVTYEILQYKDVVLDGMTSTIQLTMSNKDGVENWKVEGLGDKLKKDSVVTVENGQITITDKAGTITDQFMITGKIDTYLKTRTERTETSYVVGNQDQPVQIDITGIGSMKLQVGANEGQTLEVEIPCLKASYLGIERLDLSTKESATAAIDMVSAAIYQLSAVRSKIGAYENRIEHTITNLNVTSENMTAAYSRIIDVDMATEMTDYTTAQVLVQASTSMLAQANERPQSVLQLLK